MAANPAFCNSGKPGFLQWMLAASATVKPRYCRADEISLFSGLHELDFPVPRRQLSLSVEQQIE
jgi:hypothetical protein|tara:strand:+ start:91 stop:282 length:192 start_codon:yes stop_codon:yes gene_type:complete